MSLRLLHLQVLFAVCVLLSLVVAQDAQWLNPDGSEGDFADTYTNGDSITFKWNALNESDSSADLWIVAYNAATNGFAKLVHTDIDISKAGSVRWQLDLAGVVISEDNQFRLVFVPHNLAYYSELSTQIQSPAFTVAKQTHGAGAAATSTTSNASSSSSTTASSTTSSATTSSQTSEPSQTSVTGAGAAMSATAAAATSAPARAGPNHGLSDGAIAGIAIGAAVAVAMFIGVGILVGMRKRNTNKQERLGDEKLVPPGTTLSYHERSVDRHLSIMTAPSSVRMSRQEAFGNSKQPVELAAWDMRDSRRASQEMEGTPTVSHPSQTLSPTSPRRMSSMNSP